MMCRHLNLHCTASQRQSPASKSLLVGLMSASARDASPVEVTAPVAGSPVWQRPFVKWAAARRRTSFSFSSQRIRRRSCTSSLKGLSDRAGKVCFMSGVSDNFVMQLVEGVRTHDELATQHKARALQWLGETSDIYRRVKPRTPSPHLVSYFLLIDRESRRFLLGDHRLSGLWLPTGGHVEPDEDPVDTVRREAREELGIEAQFDRQHGCRPFFLTVTETVGQPKDRHTDVSLWFALAGRREQRLDPDEREFAAVRWWSQDELETADSSRREPHLQRALGVLAMDG